MRELAEGHSKSQAEAEAESEAGRPMEGVEEMGQGSEVERLAGKLREAEKRCAEKERENRKLAEENRKLTKKLENAKLQLGEMMRMAGVLGGTLSLN